MWQGLSIRNQLVVMVATLLTLMTLLALALTYWLDVRERQAMAVEQAATLHRALSQDLLKTLIDPSVDQHANMSFRLAGFEPLEALMLFDADEKPIYRYQRQAADVRLPARAADWPAPELSATHLKLCEGLTASGARFGTACYALGLARYHTGLRQRVLSLLLLSSLALLLGLMLAVWLGARYTLPFVELARTMRANDARTNRFQTLETQARNEVGELYAGYNAMIGQIRRATAELRYLGDHDTLTGLLNRYGFDQALDLVLGGAGQGDPDQASGHVLVEIDLDLFKLVNDSAGQIAGDNLLQQVAQLCRDHWPAPAALGRIAGDEFFALLPQCDEGRGRREARALLDRIGELRFRWEDSAFDITASAGLVAFQAFEYNRDGLMVAVNSALRQARMLGHNQLFCHRADEERQRRESAERQAASAIKEALRQGPARFELFAQPIVPLAAGVDIQAGDQPASYEILLRLRTGEGELLSPGLFLPAAEHYQLMSAIDQFVFEAFFHAMEQHPAHLEALGFASINLSGSTLTHPDFQAWFAEALARRDFPWRKLVVEVTETSAVGNLPQASDFIARCRAVGVQVALDDFGTGLSSFEYLKSLPFDRIKIDGSFIRDMLSDPVDHETVRYIHQIARLRHQSTIAEFVENHAQLDALCAIGIDYGQGYLLGRPRPLSEWLSDESANH
jgi:diguanylate cyclase (GGDEF)-like protein